MNYEKASLTASRNVYYHFFTVLNIEPFSGCCCLLSVQVEEHFLVVAGLHVCNTVGNIGSSSTVQRVDIGFSCNGLRCVALIVHHVSVDNHLVAHLDLWVAVYPWVVLQEIDGIAI